MKAGLLRRSLKFSYTEGIFASAMLGLTENYWVACAEALRVTALQAGLVSTVPHLASSFSQIGADALTQRWGGRLKTIGRLVTFQWMTLVPLVFLPWVPAEWRYALLMACAVGFAVGGSLPGPAWLSLMSSHLPEKSKGRYFGWRNMTLGAVALTAGILAGWLLQLMRDNVLKGFAILFGLGALARLVSWLFMTQMYDPPVKPAPETADRRPDIPDTFLGFITESWNHPFSRFVLFVSSFIFSVHLVAPYLAVYMLRDLNFSYTTFAFVTFSASLSSLFGFKIWGELADRFGNLRIVQATTAYIAVIPLLWFISGHPLWLVFVQLTAGFAWGGFQLCVMTYAFSEFPAHLRTRPMGYLAAMNGAAVFLGSLAGGQLLTLLPLIGRSQFLGLFILSSAARTAVILFFLNKLKISKTVQPVSMFDLYADAFKLSPIYQSGKGLVDLVSKWVKP